MAGSYGNLFLAFVMILYTDFQGGIPRFYFHQQWMRALGPTTFPPSSLAFVISCFAGFSHSDFQIVVRQKSHSHINRCRKSFWETITCFYIKSPRESRAYLRKTKAMYDKSTVVIILNEEELETIPFQTRIGWLPSVPSPFQRSAQSKRQEEIKQI